MSLFDLPSDERLGEVYPDGMPFILYEVHYEGVRDTTYGASHMASVMVGPRDKSSPPITYRVFGRLAEQTRNVKPADLPGLVRIAQIGRGYAWQKVEAGREDPELPF